MPLEAAIKETTRAIEYKALKDGGYDITIDGVTHRVDVEILFPGTYSLLVDGLQFEADVQDADDALEVNIRGVLRKVTLMDPLQKLMKASAGDSKGPKTLRSPMPGKVIQLLVKEGDEVAEDTGVIVIEAMKMQNELKASRAGTVQKIHVGEGDNVDTNAPLLVVG